MWMEREWKALMVIHKIFTLTMPRCQRYIPQVSLLTAVNGYRHDTCDFRITIKYWFDSEGPQKELKKIPDAQKQLAPSQLQNTHLLSQMSFLIHDVTHPRV